MASGRLAAFMKPSLNWFLVFVPISVYLEHFHSQAHLWIFFSACVAIIPLAGLLGEATEHIAEHAGEGIGGLLNATFGNAAGIVELSSSWPEPMDLVYYARARCWR